MRPRRLLALPLALAGSLALATAVLAGGWATVTMTDPPEAPTAEGATVIGLTVLQHGVTPVSWPAITVVARDAASGATVSGDAVASGPAGHYTVSLTFPAAGDWSLTYVSEDLVMEGSATFAVGDPVLVAGSSAATADAVPVISLSALVALFLVLAVGTILHDRRADRAVPAGESQPTPSITG
jgi:hypothetical protein